MAIAVHTKASTITERLHYCIVSNLYLIKTGAGGTYIVLSESEEVLLAVLYVLLQASDGDLVAALVPREPNVNLVLLHHLSDGLSTSTNQTTVHTMIDGYLLTDLLFL